MEEDVSANRPFRVLLLDEDRIGESSVERLAQHKDRRNLVSGRQSELRRGMAMMAHAEIAALLDAESFARKRIGTARIAVNQDLVIRPQQTKRTMHPRAAPSQSEEEWIEIRMAPRPLLDRKRRFGNEVHAWKGSSECVAASLVGLSAS